MYSQTFAQTCGIGGHFGGFTSSTTPIAVPPAHQTHYTHAHLPPPPPPQQQVSLMIVSSELINLINIYIYLIFINAWICFFL